MDFLHFLLFQLLRRGILSWGKCYPPITSTDFPPSRNSQSIFYTPNCTMRQRALLYIQHSLTAKPQKMWPTGESQDRGMRPSKLCACPSFGEVSLIIAYMIFFSALTNAKLSFFFVLRRGILSEAKADFPPSRFPLFGLLYLLLHFACKFTVTVFLCDYVF